MTRLPSPDGNKEAAFVAEQLNQRFWEMPRGLAWLPVPLFPGAAVFAVFFLARDPSDPWTPMERLIGFWTIPQISIVAGAAIAGLLLHRYLASNLAGWNVARRERILAGATADFREQFDMLASWCDRLADAADQLRGAVSTKAYSVYVERAQAFERSRFSEEAFSRFFDQVPNTIGELKACWESLVDEIEADPNAVTAYQPDLLRKIDYVRSRAAANNVLDCYRASKEVEELLEGITRRRSPFNFGPTVEGLIDQVQGYRDQILGDPDRERIWREIQAHDERLEEERRHNEAMEEAAEARVEESRRQTMRQAEGNELARQQRNALRATAVGTGAIALYERRTANATREVAEQSKRPK